MKEPKYKPGDTVIYTKKYSYIDVVLFGRYNSEEEWEYAMVKTQSGCQVKESEINKKL